MKIRVENAYSDGHQSTAEYIIPDADVPPYVRFEDAPNKDELWGEDGEEMWDHLQQWTGDGHGENADLGWFYRVAARRPRPSGRG